MPENAAEIRKILKDIIVPLVEAEGGKLRVLSADGEKVELHVFGRLAGAPGLGLLKRRVIEPAIRTAAPSAQIVITSGCRVPEGEADLAD